MIGDRSGGPMSCPDCGTRWSGTVEVVLRYIDPERPDAEPDITSYTHRRFMSCGSCGLRKEKPRLALQVGGIIGREETIDVEGQEFPAWVKEEWHKGEEK